MKYYLIGRALAALVIVTLSGCAIFVAKEQAYPVKQPLSILVVPAINNSTAAEATDYFSTIIAEPLSFHGYYVAPMELVNLVLQNGGITDGSQLLVVDPTKLGEEFGVDVVMFVTIDEWDTSYFVVGGVLR